MTIEVKAMQVGIIGAGAVGLLTAFYLSEQYHVTVYTKRQDQSKELIEQGIFLERDHEWYHASILSKVDEVYSEPYLIIAVKQHQLAGIVDRLKNMPPKKLLFIQNGMAHVEYFSKLIHHQIYVGVVEHGVVKKDDHKVIHRGVGQIKIAPYQPNLTEPLYSEYSTHTFFPIVKGAHWRDMLHSKLLVNSVVNPLTAMFGIRNGQLFQNYNFKVLSDSLFKEVIHLLELHQVEEELYAYIQGVCEKTALNHSSMLMDIKNSRQTEVDAILGYLIMLAKKKNIDSPIVHFCYYGIKGLEESRE
ncbi:2-dehydropantoate 2-reductase [Bacillus carboniphilus]|uniref:2-dehydropantoate 2-reductase n=1 Tax=Bacillus carboniphilus TaxID=86663 RepID=A0ABY9JYW7_9BACI|nr:2-dehydropantoate 2-reductase [Bacillus carboniphilus]WLR43635.1 2-dehydropantoate 2-reductase [Bacillus carboniphilus]